MNHKWKLDRATESMRYFVCENCGAGPVPKHVMHGKGSINAVAKRQGIAPDCNVEMSKDVIES